MRKERLFLSPRRPIVTLFFLLSIAVIEASDSVEIIFEPVSSEQIPNILNMLSDKARTNYESIKSWQGEIDATADIVYLDTDAEEVYKEKINNKKNSPQKIIKQRESTVEFTADIENSSFYANKYHREPLKYIDPNSGELLKSLLVEGHNISIGTPDYKIVSNVSAKKGDSLVLQRHFSSRFLGG